MKNEMVVHDAVMILTEHNVSKKDIQEEYIKRFLPEEDVVELEMVMKKYNVWYDCDFLKLQNQLYNDLKEDNFKII